MSRPDPTSPPTSSASSSSSSSSPESTPETLSEAITDFLQTYHDLNAAQIDEFDQEPSPLEFMRYVARNRPFVVRGGAAGWTACQLWWDADYLKGMMRGEEVRVAVTPYGNADSVVTRRQDGTRRFVKPLEVMKPFDEFLDDLRTQELKKSDSDGDVEYAQTQNDNLRDEYRALLDDVEDDIAWARIALEKVPDAINLWLGNSRSVTALHKDVYENIYCQIVGSKHFVLLPPIDVACVAEENLLAATYARASDGVLELQMDQPEQYVPFPTWDPDGIQTPLNQFSRFSKPLRTSLNPGDMLYLPAMWYHKVSQTCSSEGFCCAVNYWYDMDFAGPFYPLQTFYRNAVALERGQSATL